MNVLDALADFNLELLPIKWVQDVWSSNFSGRDDLPPEYKCQEENYLLVDNMNYLIHTVKDWQNPDNEGPSTDKSWHVLLDFQFDHKSLICLLSVVIKSEYSSQDTRILGLTAARLYVNLLSIPGSLALNIFNPHMFHKVLNTLELAKISTNTSYTEHQKNKCKKKSVGNHMNTIDSEMSERDVKDIYTLIGYLLCDLCECFSILHLKDYFETVRAFISILVELTRLEKHINVFLVKSLHKTSTAFISKKAYDILSALCIEEQGDVKFLVNYMMRCFLPTMITNEEDLRMSIVGQNEIKTHTRFFIEHLLFKNDPDVEDGAVALIQQLCIRLPDREEVKSRCVPEIISILKVFPNTIFQETVLWIVSLMHNKNLKHRLAAADVISALLKISNENDQSQDGQNSEKLYETLIAAILSGICDTSSMRPKCLGIFSRLILSDQLSIKLIIHKIFHPNLDINDQSSDPTPDNCIFNFHTFFCHNPSSFPSDPLPDGNRIVHLIELLTRDDKVFVRKNALQILANICLINQIFLTKHILKIFVFRCKDFYVSIRKSVAKSLTDLTLHYPTNVRLISAWVDGVMQLIVDNETKSGEKIVHSLKTILIDNITYYDRSNNYGLRLLPWKVLDAISKKEKRNLLGFACSAWNQQGYLKNPLFRILESHIGTENNTEVWYLISCLSEFVTIPHSDFIYDYYFDNIFSTSMTDEYLSLHVLEALFLNWKGMKHDTQNVMFVKFKLELENVAVPFPMISRYMDYCFHYERKETEVWSGVLVKKCEAYLSQCIAPGSTKRFSENRLCQYIVTLGEAAFFHPGVSAESLSYLANVIDPNYRGIEGDKWTGTVSWRVRSVAILTLGKVCLQDPLIAKFYTPLFASLLNKPSSPESAKINSMIALSDLCRRFTSVVEDYLGDMCVSLRDDEVNVRRNTFNLLMVLIQEDFLKLRCPLFFYLLIMHLDPSNEIRELMDLFIDNTILKKNSKIMSQHFIHGIFFFNNYQDHEKYTTDVLSYMEKIIFSLAGVNNFSERGKIYRYMLLHMGDDDRFKVCNWLCLEILEKVCEEKIPLDSRGNAVLKDALFSISCKEMRLENLRKSDVDKENEDNLITEMTKQMILSSLLKKNYMENIVPIIVRLKKKLMKHKSPLLKDVMVCLRELMKDYKDEINEILLDDPILAAEITHDLKNLVEEETSVQPEVLQIGEVTMKELRIHCERLTEDVLLNKFNISNFGTDSQKEGDPSPGIEPFSAEPIAGPSGMSRTPVKTQGRIHSTFSPVSPIPGPSSVCSGPSKRQVRSQSSFSPIAGPSGEQRTPGKRQSSLAPMSPIYGISNEPWVLPNSPGRPQTSSPIAGPSGEHWTQEKRPSSVSALSPDSGNSNETCILTKDLGRSRKTSSPIAGPSGEQWNKGRRPSSVTPWSPDSGYSNEAFISSKDQGRSRKTSSPIASTSGEHRIPGNRPSSVTPLSPYFGYINEICTLSKDQGRPRKTSTPLASPSGEHRTAGKKKSNAAPLSSGFLSESQSCKKSSSSPTPGRSSPRCQSSSNIGLLQDVTPKRKKGKKFSKPSQLPTLLEASEVESSEATLYSTSSPVPIRTDPLSNSELRKPKQHRKRRRRKRSTSSIDEEVSISESSSNN